jgi:hypothetical protein
VFPEVDLSELWLSLLLPMPEVPDDPEDPEFPDMLRSVPDWDWFLPMSVRLRSLLLLPEYV